ncbi:HlyD family secretion protein [Pseudomaricurvus sp. HS19]|uniref:HlyD family secretion protein n=1 Tax=Pseudomaricurvus sp. HS19 TaxID=2692626 RepID=UPI0013703876|nr:HlyD family secretion protein [Pseudomaricurvus sp. HS19]MYM63357.1 biotin/lipoyl-binding protein [Pseudomaricurvus sp. HS19]
MDLLLILTYTALCTVVFKVFRIPLTKWTVPTAVLGGIALIGALLIVMNYNHPYSKNAREIFFSVPVIPAVAGLVVEVDAVANQPMREGDILFRIDPVPYQARVAEIEAALQSAEIDLQRAQELVRRQAGNKRDVDLATAQVGSLKAQLASANYDLEHTEVRAPADGMVTQLALQPGTMAVTLPLRPTMVFIPNQQRMIAGSFWQNSLQRMQPGYKAEVILDGVPGHVFSGRVSRVLPALAEGDMQSSGNLVAASQLAVHGQAIAVIELDENLDDYLLPRGVQGKIAIISDHDPLHVSLIRRILLRMMGWLNYVFPIK